MKNTFQLLFAFLLLVSGFAANAQKNDLKETISSGKWVTRTPGYHIDATYNAEEADPEDEPDTQKRYKTFSFGSNNTFTLDSAKQRYSGRYRISGDEIILDFNPVSVTHLRKNMDPNNSSTDYITEHETVKLPKRALHLSDNGKMTGDGFTYKNYSGAISGLFNFYEFSGFANVTWKHMVMLIIGLFFIFLAIRYEFEPLLLIPIGFGILIGNIPMFQVVDFNLKLGIYEPGSVLNILYQGVVQGWYPPLIFLGIGAMTDFSSLISNPKLMLLGASAQIGIFLTFLGAIWLGFAPPEAGAIGIIGGADGPTAIFISSKLANGLNVMANGETVKNLIGPIAIAAYSYMALVPVIQPPVIKLLTSKRERLIKMKPPRAVSKLEKILFPIVGLLLTAYIAPSALPLLGMLFFGNLLKESGVTKRLAATASNALIDTITILLGLTVGASTQADVFLNPSSVKIFGLGAASFVIATAGGVAAAKLMNMFMKKGNKINPMIGACGVSAVPDSARVVQHMGLKEDPTNHLLMHAMAPNVSGVIGSAVAAGILLSFLM
ncbi:oxaloacetate decarboxylase, beta subunit [Tangfeifania diversioriginum]|uniref:Oxaloacetate decarboxylase, beta subunit n=1 Tax=Tangfeifania diversioriginum TaxID=1168035 RepID=A0A1M6H068_9BACT|nr:sodium ion-translocating decarboxylase subunit beta [Tangfeifania diversioriginum]SHJ15555.1 oxaloacetate decarboxylase, beta subunit [Tangfeifania diversioriginum]